MSLRKRLRIIWAALTQNWQEDRCQCGALQFTNGERWSDPIMCVACESRQFENWMADYQARQRASKGAA